MRLFWVNIPYATFGILAANDIVTTAAPIAKWMEGKSLADIKPWLLKKKAKVIELQRHDL